MTEYISREDALAVVCEGCNIDFYKEPCEPSDCRIRGFLRSIPAADVREVVLCRDCVNYVESDEANGEKMCVIDAEWCEEDGCYYGFTAYTEPDWFCAGGIKREES